MFPLQNVGEDEKELKKQWEIDRLSKELEWLQVEKFGLQQFASSASDLHLVSWLQHSD